MGEFENRTFQEKLLWLLLETLGYFYSNFWSHWSRRPPNARFIVKPENYCWSKKFLLTTRSLVSFCAFFCKKWQKTKNKKRRRLDAPKVWRQFVPLYHHQLQQQHHQQQQQRFKVVRERQREFSMTCFYFDSRSNLNGESKSHF